MKTNKKYIRLTREEIIDKLTKHNKNKIESILKDGFRGYLHYEDYELIKEYQKEIDNKSHIIIHDPLISAIRPTKNDLKQLYDDLMNNFNGKLNCQKIRDEIIKYSSKWCTERRLGLRPYRCNEEINPPEVIDNNCIALNLCEPVQPDGSHKFYTLILGNNENYIIQKYGGNIITVK